MIIIITIKEIVKNSHWETFECKEIFQKLNTSTEGLILHDANQRLIKFGKNKLPEGPKNSIIKKFLLQFNNSLIYVLLGASVLTFVMNHMLDTFVILGVVIINAIVGFIQENKAERALDGIKNLLSLKSNVIRNGERFEISAENLVPGDIILLATGDKIPADIRLTKVSNLKTDESSLTGESDAIIKSTKICEKRTVLSERECMVFAGTTIVSGSAVGVVVGTGIYTEIGKINVLLTKTHHEHSPLMKKMDSLSKALSVIILIFSIVLVIYASFFTKMSLVDNIIAVVGLAVAALPEGLPAIVTVTLALGVRRMSAKNALVRRLQSVETLGSVTVICSDKTGTLTQNKMIAKNIYTAFSNYDVLGEGYDPAGQITLNNSEIDYKKLQKIIEAAYICNDSHIIHKNGAWNVSGAATEAALRVLAHKAGFDKKKIDKIYEIPFDSKYKYRTTLCEIENKKIIFALGAPEKLINFCEKQLSENGKKNIDHKLWEEKIQRAANKGQRLVGCAYKETNFDKVEITHADLEENLIFSGIIGIIDPPRHEAIEAAKLCKDAGIKVKMITGDHEITARVIALQMGLTENPVVISGWQLEEMNDEEIKVAANKCDIFARTSPEHKFRLVKALQELGEVVAMTGDGVNDAPALKKADIGVAMGVKGSEIAKDAAEMVLADDNFRSIVSAVQEGRTIYENIKKTILFIFATNGAEMLVMSLAMVLGIALPISPVGILWANMVTALTSALSLIFEPSEKDIMKKPPRNSKDLLISKSMVPEMVVVSVIITAFAFVFFNSYNNNFGAAYAQTMSTNMLIFGEMFYLFCCRRMQKTVISKGFWQNKTAFLLAGILVLIQIIYTHAPFMQNCFGTVSINIMDWAKLFGSGLLIFFAVEAGKIIIGRRKPA
ncbi:MAG: HAD-IC family P-type ATPase [Oscillospiraceae bacterium]|jgi:magnesium-transporting ATPase (P-type)|nr:HAD-IC family P-type ATPase [Oscillospiraceae bacterium]